MPPGAENGNPSACANQAAPERPSDDALAIVPCWTVEWWRRRESFYPQTQISQYFKRVEAPDSRDTLKSRGSRYKTGTVNPPPSGLQLNAQLRGFRR